MRRIVLVLVLLGLVGMMTPAQAVVGLPTESACAGPVGGGPNDCYQVEGFAGDIYASNSEDLACGSRRVNSIYVGNTDVNRYVEVGYVQEKSDWPACDSTWHIFVAHETPTSNGQIRDYYQTMVALNAKYRFLAYRYSTTSSAFRFAYDNPLNGLRVVIPVEVTIGVLQAVGHANFEIKTETDYPGPWIRNVWLKSYNDHMWYPANGSRNLVCHASNMDNYHIVPTRNSGSNGDSLNIGPPGDPICF